MQLVLTALSYAVRGIGALDTFVPKVVLDSQAALLVSLACGTLDNLECFVGLDFQLDLTKGDIFFHISPENPQTWSSMSWISVLLC